MKELLGTWRLLSYSIEKAGTWDTWLGKVHGTLIYSPDGFVSVGWSRYLEGHSQPERTTFYTAKYQVEESQVVHHVLESEVSSRIGSKFLRKFSIEKN